MLEPVAGGGGAHSRKIIEVVVIQVNVGISHTASLLLYYDVPPNLVGSIKPKLKYRLNATN